MFFLFFCGSNKSCDHPTTHPTRRWSWSRWFGGSVIFMKLSSMLWAMPLAQSEGPSWWGKCRFPRILGLGILFVTPKGCIYFWSLLSPSDLHPFGFGIVINFREKISSKCQKKEFAVFPKLHIVFDFGSHPLAPAPFLLTRHQLRNRHRRSTPTVTSSPPRHGSLDGKIAEAKQTPQRIFKHFQADSLHFPKEFLLLTYKSSRKTAGNQDAEPGTSTQGRSIPQLLHAGVVWIRRGLTVEVEETRQSMVWGMPRFSLGMKQSHGMITSWMSWWNNWVPEVFFLNLIFVFFKIKWVCSVFVFFCFVVWESFQKGVWVLLSLLNVMTPRPVGGSALCGIWARGEPDVEGHSD